MIKYKSTGSAIIFVNNKLKRVRGQKRKAPNGVIYFFSPKYGRNLKFAKYKSL